MHYLSPLAIIAAKFAVNMPSCKKNKVGLLFQQFSQPDNAGQREKLSLGPLCGSQFLGPLSQPAPVLERVDLPE